jgi:hypothetical protein
MGTKKGPKVNRIKITPRMVRAGYAELAGYDPQFGETQGPETVEAIYLAMERVRRASLGKLPKARIDHRIVRRQFEKCK